MTPAALWRDRRFRFYWTAQTISEIGDRVSELALPLLAVALLDAGAAEVGVLFAAIWAPSLVSLFVGTWVDRLPSKRRVLVFASLAQAAAIAVVPVAYVVGVLSLPLLYGVAVAGGFGRVLFNTANPTFFVHLVRREQYVEANSLLSTTRSASFIAGPPLAGLLIRVLTAPIALAVDACSFLLSALMISRVAVDEPHPVPHRTATFRRQLVLGIGYLRRHPYLRASLACSTTLNLFNLMVQAVLILYASRELDLAAGSIGLAFGVGATGGIAGAATAGRLGRLIGTGRTIVLGAIMFSIPYAALPLAEGGSFGLRVGTVSGAVFVAGFGVMLFDITNNTVRTVVTNNEMRSRVAGAYSTVNYGIRPFGALLGGWSAEHIGVPATLVIASLAGSLAVTWLFASPIIRIRNIADLEMHPTHPVHRDDTESSSAVGHTDGTRQIPIRACPANAQSANAQSANAQSANAEHEAD